MLDNFASHLRHIFHFILFLNFKFCHGVAGITSTKPNDDRRQQRPSNQPPTIHKKKIPFCLSFTLSPLFLSGKKCKLINNRPEIGGFPCKDHSSINTELFCLNQASFFRYKLSQAYIIFFWIRRKIGKVFSLESRKSAFDSCYN